MAQRKDTEIHNFFKKDLDEVKEKISNLQITMARVDEGIKRINGSIQRHEEAIFKHEGFIESTKARVGIVAGIISALIAGGITLIIKFIGDK